VLFAACAGIFGLGETLLQPTIPAITNDLATDANRGRYNALMAMGVSAIVAPMRRGSSTAGSTSGCSSPGAPSSLSSSGDPGQCQRSCPHPALPGRPTLPT
jgi:MFS family permease